MMEELFGFGVVAGVINVTVMLMGVISMVAMTVFFWGAVIVGLVKLIVAPIKFRRNKQRELAELVREWELNYVELWQLKPEKRFYEEDKKYRESQISDSEKKIASFRKKYGWLLLKNPFEYDSSVRRTFSDFSTKFESIKLP